MKNNRENGIFSFNVGKFDIYTLVESEREGNTSILKDADENLIKPFIPAQGFKHSANAFLVKAGGQNILIDTGTGQNGVIVNKIKSLGVTPENVNAVLITHLHGDHFGSLQKDGKAVFPCAKIYISQKELEYFTVTNINQGAAAALSPYKNMTVTFNPSDLDAKDKIEILPGIFPVAAYGHTPGHTIYLLESEGSKLLIIGDLLHIAAVQFHLPSINAVYDMDGAASAGIRAKVLSFAQKNKIPVGGMHIEYPGTGTLEAYNNGESFNYIPME
ncbi:MAG: MBL fold metallo-hydrolase [Treponema sp.]|nr:MBL fold metallo-hydrolase [Treponema sp.]